jgi:hypothetical protein
MSPFISIKPSVADALALARAISVNADFISNVRTEKVC